MDWDDSKYVATDFETSGELPEYALQPWRFRQGKFWATSLSWVQKEPDTLRVRGGLFPKVEMMRAFLEEAIAEGRTIVGWNVAFDISVFIAYGLKDLVFKAKWLDGMLLWKHAEREPEYEVDRSKKKSYRLKLYVKQYIPGYAGYEDDVDFHSTDPAELAKLQRYNDRDTMFTLVGARYWWSLLTDKQQRAALIEAESLPMIALANLEGMLVDTPTTHALVQTLTATAAARLESLRDDIVASGLAHETITTGPKKKPLTIDQAVEAVVRSPMKLARLLYDCWGLPVLKETTGEKTGAVNRATDKEVLHELAFKDPRAKLLREYREALNNRTKFAEAPLEAARYNDDGRAHPLAIPFGTYSGRLTYASKQGKNKDERQIGFAIHQEKNAKIFREIIIPPQGYTLMEFDASGQEFRWMAIQSGDATMLQLCLPGEDPHSYMGARIALTDYHEMIAGNKAGDAKAKDGRKMGKVANLCIAEGTLLLTDRGVCSIEHLRGDDRVWDGVEFVAHTGVVCSGVKPVISHDGVTATPTHEVLVDGEWWTLEEATQHGRLIEPAMGKGWSRQYRATLRIVDGIARRTVSEVGGALRARAVRLWVRARREFTVHGDWAVNPMQGMRNASTTSTRRTCSHRDRGGSTTAEACQRLVPAVPQPKEPILSQLRRAWHRVSVRIRCGGGELREGGVAAPDLPQAGHRPRGQQWSLRDWKLALGYAQGEPCEQATARVYDVTNCGPRARFTANGKIVHNSLQYRTSAQKLRVVARVQYNIPMELPQAERIHATYQRTYPKVPEYWKAQILLAKKQGYVETLAGRRVQLDGDWKNDGWAMGSTSINYPIQGTGACQKYLAMAVLKPYLIKIGAYFGWDLHDGIYIYVPHHRVPEAAVEIKRRLDNLPYKQAWNFSPPIPLPWDCKVGESWGALKDYKFS